MRPNRTNIHKMVKSPTFSKKKLVEFGCTGVCESLLFRNSLKYPSLTVDFFANICADAEILKIFRFLWIQMMLISEKTQNT